MKDASVPQGLHFSTARGWREGTEGFRLLSCIFSTSFLKNIYFMGTARESHWKSKPVSYLPSAVFKEIVHVWRSAFWCKVKFTRRWEQGLVLVCLTSKNWNCSRKGSDLVFCFRVRIWIFSYVDRAFANKKWCCQEITKDINSLQCSKIASFCFIKFVAAIICVFVYLDVFAFGFGIWVYMLSHSI